MIIVTGANGQLSLAIRTHLERAGHDSQCMSVRGEQWAQADFTEVDTIIHVAGIVPKPGVKPEDFYSVNSRLTASLAKKAKNEGVKHFIYISSMAVYGLQPSLKATEGIVTADTPCRPQSDYGKSKLRAEEALRQLETDHFHVAIVRVPSIYSEAKQEYFEQYRLIMDKFRCIPTAFKDCYRSAIYLPNLCELITLIVENGSTGLFCPDDGPTTASDICAMISPQKFRSRICGLAAETLLRRHPMIPELFGAIAYHPSLANAFGGTYRKHKFVSAD